MLLGRNGAGKTTTLRTIMGLWHASAGVDPLRRRRHHAWATPDIAQLGIAYVPETMGIFADLTVRENLLLAARSGPIDETRLRLDLRPVPGAEEILVARRRACSPAGRSRCSSIARAIIEPRKLLLIDEPTKGLAPAIIDNMIEAFRELKKHRHHDPAGRAEFPCSPSRSATRSR